MTDKPKSEIKVTDKRIFTAEGEIREEFRQEIKAEDPLAAKPADTPAAPAEAPAERRQTPNPEPPASGERRNKSIADKAQNPGTPFADFVEPLTAQAHAPLGTLRHPSAQTPQLDTAPPRQL